MTGEVFSQQERAHFHVNPFYFSLHAPLLKMGSFFRGVATSLTTYNPLMGETGGAELV